MVHNRVIANVPCDYKFKLTNKYFFVIILGCVSHLLMSCCCCCCCACFYYALFEWVSLMCVPACGDSIQTESIVLTRGHHHSTKWGTIGHTQWEVKRRTLTTISTVVDTSIPLTTGLNACNVLLAIIFM